MSIWNKVLLGLIFIAALAFVYLSARTLRTHEYWRELAERHEVRIAALEAENTTMVSGKEDERSGELVQKGIVQLKGELEKLLIDRGRVWFNCAPQGADAQTGQVRVATDLPDPHGIEESAVLYVFEEADVEQEGQYIGQFKVTAVAEKQVSLEPMLAMTSQQLQRLTRSRGPWVLYDVMPVDNHYLFAELTDEEKRAILPEGSVEEYIKNGEPATWEKLEEWGLEGFVVDEDGVPLIDDQGRKMLGVEGTYRRQLRDYRTVLEIYHRQRTELTDLREAAERDLQYISTALEDAKRQVAFRQQEVAALKADLAKYRAERDAVVAHHQAVEKKIGELQRGIELVMADNRAKAAQIARIQHEATRQIDERTRSVAHAAEGVE